MLRFYVIVILTLPAFFTTSKAKLKYSSSRSNDILDSEVKDSEKL